MAVVDRYVQIAQHIGQRKQKILYIVVHDTGNTSINANAAAHLRYFRSTDRKASADFVVDDKECVKLNDYHKYFSWHCGDGKGRYGITNSNSVGIEMCVNSNSNQYLVHQKTIELIAFLMEELNIPIDRVVRHYDASRKCCPCSLSHNNWNEWHKFKEKLKFWTEQASVKWEDTIPLRVLINGEEHLINGYFKNNKNYVSIREIAELLGCKVDYSGSVPIIER